MAGGSGGPPKLDGRNYAYWKARMAGYLEAINPIAWAVTEKPIVGPWNEDQVKYGARAKNALFDALSEEIFARVHSKKTSHEIWEALEAIYVGSKKLREEKYQVLKEKLNEFRACLAGLRLFQKQLRLRLLRWSGFSGGVGAILENVWQNSFTC